MGLLDRWKKKQTKDQLAKDEPVVKVAKKTGAAKEPVKEVKAEDYAEKPNAKSKGSSYNLKVIIRPLVTEKSAVNESKNKYTFIVSGKATKTQVKQAVKQIYGQMPAVVNMVNVEGRAVRFGRNFGRRSDYKKAIVTMPKGKTISIHEGV